MNVGLYELRSFSMYNILALSINGRTYGRETNQPSSQQSQSASAPFPPFRVYGVVQQIELLTRRLVLDINGNKVKDVMTIYARLLVSSKPREGGTEGGGGRAEDSGQTWRAKRD